MLLAASEGRHWRYEVCEHPDGYLVQMRDLVTGEIDDEFTTIFRTMPVAFAYAEMSAADDEPIEFGLEATERNFIDLSDRLHDEGVNTVAIRAWEIAHERQAEPVRRLH
jgi:hypothetical protein